MNRLLLSLALLSATSVAPAMAEPVDGFYIAGSAALMSGRDQSISSVDTGFGPQPGGYLGTDPGLGAGLAAGWGFGNGLRAELELSYRKARFDRATAGALTDAETNGDFSQSSVFVNAYYDMASRKVGAFTPYVGAGLGVSRVAWGNAVTFNDVESVGHNSRDSGMAAQVMIGATYDLPQAEGFSISGEFRHTRMLDDLSFGGQVLESRFGSFPITSNVSDTRRNEIVVTLRRTF